MSKAALMRKSILRDTIKLLLLFKEQNNTIVTVRKLRLALERYADYTACTTNFISINIGLSLEWLYNSNYIGLKKMQAPKKYLIPDEFTKNGTKILQIQDFFS